MNYTNAHVLVTGGAGFIGSHIVEALVQNGAHVTVLDNLSTGSLDNLASVYDQIHFIKGSILDADLCLRATEEMSHIFHLAASTSVPFSMKNPALCHAINVTGTFNLLESARIQGVSRFIFSSSSAVYGEQTKQCSEKTACAPTSVYGYSKLIGEMYCQEYTQVHHIPTLSLRYFNVIGPRQNPNGPYAGVYAQFKNNMEKNMPITIFGNGKQIRDFIPVSEVVKANLLLAQLPTQLCDGKPINIGTGTGTSINTLYSQLQEEYPLYSLPPLYQEQRPGDIQTSTANCKLYKTLQEMVL